MTGERRAPSAADAFVTSGMALSLAAAWLYFAGWSYAYTYFIRFGITMLLADIPFDHLLVYGGLVLLKELWLSVVFSCLIVSTLLATIRWSSILNLLGLTIIGFVLMIGAFEFAHFAGDRAGERDFRHERATDYATYPRVELAWRGTSSPPNNVIGNIISSDCSKLLLAADGRLFLINPVNVLVPIDTIVLDTKDIQVIRILGTPGSCSY